MTFGGPDSVVELRLTSQAPRRTVFELDHEVRPAMAGSGAGALFVGPGWDGALLANCLYLAGEIADDPVAAANSPEAQEFSRASVEAWVSTVEDSGTADAEQIESARQMGPARFAPELADPPSQD